MTRHDVFQAIRRRDKNLQSLLDGISDIDARDEDGQNLLHEAAASTNPAAAYELIRRGIDVNGQDRNGQTPLHFAGIHNCSAVAEAILSNGGALTVVDSHGNTPLWSAVFNARGKYDTVRVMMGSQGKDVVSVKNKHGRSPLDFARQIGDDALLRLLST